MIACTEPFTVINLQLAQSMLRRFGFHPVRNMPGHWMNDGNACAIVTELLTGRASIKFGRSY